MDIPQLKLLAARIRELLKDSACLVGHSQSLDLVAALPGLRNWPEVNAFPDRVAACHLDLAATGRLAFRLNKKLELHRSPQQLLDLLQPVLGTSTSPSTLEIWPGGPPAGVYLTTSETAIKALLTRYEEATDGAVVYAERVAIDHPGSIDLGESGLWSKGLERVPSGTLLVLGPIEVDQQSWEDAGQRLDMACLRAYNGRHRVAILIETPTPDTLFEDVRLMVRLASELPDTSNDDEIVGAVDEHGNLVTQPTPTFLPLQRPLAIPLTATLDAIPPAAVEPLRQALATRSTGLLLFGTTRSAEHTAIELVSSSLALTEHAGPAARIMPRHRGTPSKDWLVPDPIRALPFLPSIQSAYAQGYRRMLISTNYTRTEMLLSYPDVLFIGSTYGHEVQDVARLVLLSADDQDRAALGALLIASLGLLHVPTKGGTMIAPDLLVMPSTPPKSEIGFSEFEQFLLKHRQLRWEDTVAHLLDAGACSADELKKAMPRNHHLVTFIAQRRKLAAKAVS